ncbi:MAG: ATP-binding cassette domain-containing protein [Verrucomicrobiales bacterium]
MKYNQPVWRGQAVHAVPLKQCGDRLVIGRVGGTQDGGSDRIDLDGDSTISRTHVGMERADDGWIIEDTSRVGTELNGQSFLRQRLVYGDRFRIGGFVFEFTYHQLVVLPQEGAGSILAKGLSFTAGGKEILRDIELEIEPGQFVGILGGSGQGKSTLLNALCGLRRATSGRAYLNGEDVNLGKAKIGFVPQDDIVHGELVVRDAIRMSAELRLKLPGHAITEVVERTIERLGLLPHAEKRIYQLSGGQRKRVSIATELLTRPDVLFLDEPSSGLDPATEESLMAMLQTLTLTGLTVVCTTHVLQRAYLFDRILYIHAGRLIFSGNADEARRHFLLDNQSASDSVTLERSPLDRIYSLAAQESFDALAWQEQFRTSKLYKPVPEAPTQNEKSSMSTPLPKVASSKVLNVLLKRQRKIFSADFFNLLFFLAQPLAIGFLIGWVGSDYGLAAFLVVIAAMWFGCSNGAQTIVSELPIFRRESVCGLGLLTYQHSKLWFLGGITVLQTVLLSLTTLTTNHIFHPREDLPPTFEQEMEARLVPPEQLQAEPEDVFIAMEEGMDVTSTPDVARSSPPPEAKRPELALATLSKVALWFDLRDNLLDSKPQDLRDNLGNPLRNEAGEVLSRPGVSPWLVVGTTLGLRVGALGLAALIGVMLGITISSLVRNATQAVMWVPLILIPQILFGGFVVTLADMSPEARAFSRVMPSASLQRVMEVSQLYGMATPFLSNRTKTPLFLTADGRQDIVRWELEGIAFSQDYYALSDFNTAWQNRAIVPERLGQHKREFDRIVGSSQRIERDIVSRRHDVIYLKGTPFFHLGALQAAWIALGGCALLCYVVTLLGLSKKRKG